MKQGQLLLLLCLLGLLIPCQTNAQVPHFGKSIIDSIRSVNIELLSDAKLNYDSIRNVVDHDELGMYHGYNETMLRKDVANAFSKIIRDYSYAYRLSDVEAKKYLQQQESSEIINQHTGLFTATQIWSERIEKASALESKAEILKLQAMLKQMVNGVELKHILESCVTLPKSSTCTKFARLYSYTNFERHPQMLTYALDILFFNVPVKPAR